VFTITKQFITAGKAIFTVHNRSGKHYTYKVSFKKGSKGFSDCYFVSLLTGSNNELDYTYLGMLNPDTGMVKLTRASKLTNTAKSVQVIRWALRMIWKEQETPEGYGVHGEGRCGRCGRPLTAEPGVNPEGERFGFGPSCWAKMQGR